MRYKFLATLVLSACMGCFPTVPMRGPGPPVPRLSSRLAFGLPYTVFARRGDGAAEADSVSSVAFKDRVPFGRLDSKAHVFLELHLVHGFDCPFQAQEERAGHTR